MMIISIIGKPIAILSEKFKKEKVVLVLIESFWGQKQMVEVKTMEFKRAEDLRNKLLSHFATQYPNLSVVLDKNDMEFEDDEGWLINIF
jgi:hypothetical protein